MTFPLPLTTIEESMFWEDRPAYPWSCFMRLRFSGCLTRDVVERATEKALDRHPLLRAKVALRRLRRPQWVDVKDPRPVIHWQTGEPQDELPAARHLDLQKEIGLRLHVTAGKSSEVVFQFHHACCDGRGILAFIEDWLIVYASASHNEAADAPVPALEPERLSVRGRYGLTIGRFIRMLPRQAVGLMGAWQFLGRKPIPIVPQTAQPDDTPPPKGYPATLHHRFRVGETSRIVQAAKRFKVTVNDLLARDFFMALQQWRSQQGISEDDRWLRMMIPVDLRPAEGHRLPAANLLSCVFLDRRGRDLLNRNGLLESIHREMDLIKRNKLGFTFVFGSAVYRWLPGGMRRGVRKDKCSISCIFSNLGRYLCECNLPREAGRIVAGNVRLEGADLVTPIRPYGCITLNAGTYADVLSMTLHYDPRPLSRQQAEQLMGLLVNQIAETVGSVVAPDEQ